MYRAIHETFWTDPALRAVGHEARNLFAFLVTGPGAHISGVYRLTFATLADDFMVSIDKAKKLLDKLIDAGFVSYDFDRSIVWVHNMYRHQPKGPNHKRSVEQQLTKLHGSHLADLFCEYYSDLDIHSPTVVERSDNGFGTVLEPKRVKEKDKGKGKGINTPPTPPTGGATKRRASKDPDLLKHELSGVNISLFIKQYEPQGLDVVKCFDRFTEYVLTGNAKKPFPNPSNWTDLNRAFHDSCKGAIDKGMYLVAPTQDTGGDDEWTI